jgi:integrase
MASLHKDPRGKSPYYYCAYTLPNGRRVFKSTKQTDRGKAEEFRRGVDRAVKLGAKGELTETRARDLIAEIFHHTTGEPLRFYTTEAWLRQWLEGKRKAKASASYLKYRHTIEGFLASIGERARRNINQITPREIQRFRDLQSDAGKHPSTCDSVLKHLRMPFKAAVRQGYISHNPAEAVELLHSKGSDSTKGTFDLHQVGALIKAASGEWKAAIVTAFYTGARLQDVANLRWQSVDLEKQLISFLQAKTGKPVVIPIHPQLLIYLIDLPGADSDQVFLFPSIAGKRTGGKSGLSMAFSRIMERAKIERQITRRASGQGRNVHSLSFHSFRHSFNSVLANNGVTQELRQRLTGHSSSEQNTRYTHHELSPLREAIAVMPSLQ